MKWLAAVILLCTIPASGLAQTKPKPAAAAQEVEARTTKEIETRTGHKLNSTAAAFSLPEGVALDDGVTEDEAVALALWNNAALQAELPALGLARADLIQAGQLTNPQLTLIFPFSFRILEAVANWPFEALWQRPKRLAAAQLEMERVGAGLIARALDVVRDARLAYADYAAARLRAEGAAGAVRERREIAVIVNARFRAGDISELETSASVVEARLVEEQADRFTREAALAKERLRAQLGLALANAPAFEIKVTDNQPDTRTASLAPDAAATPQSADTLNELIKQALDARPELKVAELAIEAAGARAKWERSRILAVSALAKEYGRGANGFEQGPGLQIELPLFNRNQGGIARAEAEIERAARQLIAARQRVVAEVREAYLQLAQARAAHDEWRARVLPPLAEERQRAGQAYQAGDVAYLFVLETNRRLTDAQLRAADFAATTARALVQLERSVGRRLFAKD